MNKVILVVDDDFELRKSLKIGLEKEGFAVITAESAEFAAGILSRLKIDAMVLDRMMTGIDGLSFLKKLRESGDAVPVIMLTAMNGGDNAIEGLSGGADDYLAKPFKLRELVLRLSNILKKSKSEALKMPAGLSVADGEFFINKKMLALSDAEKNALFEMLGGGFAGMAPMVAKRLRHKLSLANLKNIDIIAVRGKGYKMVSKLK